MNDTKPEIEISISHQIEVLYPGDHQLSGDWPVQATLTSWIGQALDHLDQVSSEVSVKVVSRAEMSSLNSDYRDKPEPTNVLSFPLHASSDEGRPLLGDIAICAEVVSAEAHQQGKTISAHVAHLAVHGVLHLLGYEHIDDDDALKMEQIEIAILRTIGFPNPYVAL